MWDGIYAGTGFFGKYNVIINYHILKDYLMAWKMFMICDEVKKIRLQNSKYSIIST